MFFSFYRRRGEEGAKSQLQPSIDRVSDITTRRSASFRKLQKPGWLGFPPKASILRKRTKAVFVHKHIKTFRFISRQLSGVDHCNSMRNLA